MAPARTLRRFLTLVILGFSVSACGGGTGSTVPPSATGSPSGSSVPARCVPASQYCETFSGNAAKWPSQNQQDYFEGYDPYVGGSYRMVQRAASTSTALAPVGAAKVSQDFSVQLDTDAILGADSSPSGEFGFVCWQHPVRDDTNGALSGFLLIAGTDSAQIVLWDNAKGTAHQIASQKIPGLVKTSGLNHLTAQCIQGTDGTTATAQLSLTVNGQQAVAVQYATSEQNYVWSVAEADANGEMTSGLGLAASGDKEDVFFKNFAITSKCQPGGDFPCPSPSPLS